MQRGVLLVATTVWFAVGSCLAIQWQPVDTIPAPALRRPPRVAAPHHAPAVITSQPAAAVPLRPEQMPVVPPQVSFRDGQLTIAAQNCTLGDILRAVRNQTGAAVDVPANATERVAGSFGPGPARDVLSALLNGSHFNYVLLGSATNPDALEHVILLLKSGTTEQAASASETASAVPPAPAENPDMVAEDQGDQAPEENNLFAEDPATPAEDQAQNPFAQPAANARTPEQMLQDMQQHQQEIQQQIQQRQQQLGINPGLQVPRGMPPPGGIQPQPQ